jgi:uncharacterized protein
VISLFEDLVRISQSYQRYIGCHGYEHTERVVELCSYLGKILDADLEVIIPAAILHDIGRDSDNHAYHGAFLAKKILEDLGYTKIDEIVHAIEVHSFSTGGEANSIEAQILSDADKLDAMGAVGIYRAAQYGVENDCKIDEFIRHFREKLLLLKELLYTDEAKKLANLRHKFMLEYVNEIEKELKGSG